MNVLVSLWLESTEITNILPPYIGPSIHSIVSKLERIFDIIMVGRDDVTDQLNQMKEDNEFYYRIQTLLTRMIHTSDTLARCLSVGDEEGVRKACVAFFCLLYGTGNEESPMDGMNLGILAMANGGDRDSSGQLKKWNFATEEWFQKEEIETFEYL